MTDLTSSNPIFQLQADIVANREIGPGLYWLDLYAPEITQNACPGHFVHLVVSDTSKDDQCSAWLRHTPLLRRPFSIADRDLDTGIFGLIYRVVGGGTETLATRRIGESLDVLGPLGCMFEPVSAGRSAVMVAGGVGVAPFFFLAYESIRTGQATPEDVTVLFGATTAGLLSGEEKFQKMGVSISLATDDGSMGHHGFVTVLLEDILESDPDRCDYIYACGPTPMMRRSQTIAREWGRPGQVSLEGIMPCGIGVCMACVVPCLSPDSHDYSTWYARVCCDGPVFDMQEVVLA